MAVDPLSAVGVGALVWACWWFVGVVSHGNPACGLKTRGDAEIEPALGSLVRATRAVRPPAH